MASSLTTTASFLGSIGVAKQPSVSRRSLIVAKAAKADDKDITKGSCDSRRAVMFAAATAAICAIGSGLGIAFAGEDEPKRGTLEAKKRYAPVCVTMPTARICRN